MGRARFRPLLARGAAYSVGMYALLIGGTFTGVTVSRLQRISLSVLTAVILAWLIVVWRSPQRTRPGAPFDPLYAVWAVPFALSTLAHPFGRSLLALWYMALYAGVWLVLGDLRQRGVASTAFSDLLVIAALPLIYWALAQALPWFPRWWAARDLGVPFYPARPVGTLGNPNLLGAFLAIALPFGLARLLTLPDRAGRALMAGWLALILGTLYLTYSRGAWLGAAAGVAVFGALAFSRGLRRFSVWPSADGARRHLRWLAAAAGVAAIPLVLVAASLASQAFQSPQRETGARLGYLALALDRFAARPWTGIGLFTFGRELSAAESIPPEQPHAHAHNLVATVAAELGVLGLVALALTAAWIIYALRHSLNSAGSRQARLNSAAAAGAITAIAVHSLADMPLMAPSLTLSALIALAAGIFPAGPERPLPRWRGAASRAVLSAFWIALLATGWLAARTSARYEHGLSLVVAGDFRVALADLRAAADAQPWNALYRAEYAYAAGLAAGQGDTEAAAEAVAAYQQALRREPDQALWWANLAAVEWGRGDRAQTLAAMRQAVATAPEAPDLWLNLGRFAEASGDHPAALRAYRRALQLAPRLASAVYWRATPLRRVALATGSRGPYPESVARRIWLAGDESGAVELLHRKITRDSTQPRPAIEIARLALETGQVERAEAHLRAAEALHPLGADAAWIGLLRAGIAARRSDSAEAEALRAHAAAIVTPDTTGHRLMYGGDIAQFQFLSLTVPGKLLPQLVVLGPDPSAAQAARGAD